MSLSATALRQPGNSSRAKAEVKSRAAPNRRSRREATPSTGYEVRGATSVFGVPRCRPQSHRKTLVSPRGPRSRPQIGREPLVESPGPPCRLPCLRGPFSGIPGPRCLRPPWGASPGRTNRSPPSLGSRRPGSHTDSLVRLAQGDCREADCSSVRLPTPDQSDARLRRQRPSDGALYRHFDPHRLLSASPGVGRSSRRQR